jgi:hypothetical protein
LSPPDVAPEEPISDWEPKPRRRRLE